MPYREQNSNKGTFGKVLNVAGSENYIGAAYLSSLAAYKIGAGYVALASCEKVLNSVSQLLPETVLLSREKAIDDIGNYTVLIIGCGLGVDKNTAQYFEKIISKYREIPNVIDADGLNITSGINNIQLPEKSILTPHPAEAARLLGINTEDVLSDLKGSAKSISEKYKCVTVLKTHHTLICNTDLTIHINEHGNSALAKAGTGDVLAGIIAGLLAQKISPFEAAKLGVYLHSRAGEIASEHLTEYSVLATDVIKYLPNAISELV